jgi:hypothetical protein
MNPEQENVIYVSYADADEDWVITLVNGLKMYLRKQLGELDDNFIWAKYMLRGRENRLTVPPQYLQQSRYLLIVLSPAYLKIIGDHEIDLFNNVDYIFIVECNKTKRPKKLEPLTSYQFWHEDKTGEVIRWADPEPLSDERKYYRLLDQMARDIATVVNKPKNVISNTPAQINIHESQATIQVFINATEEDRAVALDVQKRLNGNIVSSMLPAAEIGLSPQEVQKELEENLFNCDTAIVICDQAPLKWVYQQIQSIFKLNVKRKREKKLDVKIVVVNKPPPDNLERLLGLKFPNLKVLDCAEIADCMPNITEIILS